MIVNCHHYKQSLIAEEHRRAENTQQEAKKIGRMRMKFKKVFRDKWTNKKYF
jgi:hypothetical protein